MDNSLKHLAVVVDGLGPPAGGDGGAAAERGAEALKVLLGIAGEAFRLLPEITALSLFSPEFQEWACSPAHSRTLYSLCHPLFLDLRRTAIENGADLLIIGNLRTLPDPWPEIESIATAPPRRSKGVNYFLNYSGRGELAHAADRCLADHPEGEVSEKTFASYLLTAGQPDPDLVVYAGGELEPKDFLLWQASYAEIWHSPGDCRSFTGSDLRRAVENFSHRHRRFGRV